jgi:hypothetical protein
MALLETPRAVFSDHDTVLHLLLGLVSGARRLETVLPELPATPPTQSLSPLDAETERRVLLLLGLISVRRTVLDTLEPQWRAARSAPPREAPSASAEDVPGPRALLR